MQPVSLANTRAVPVGRRIAVYGPSGSGKSTLSRQLGETLGLPVLELDSVFHAYPNWVDLDREAFREKVSAYLAEHRDGWVLDGNYSHVRDLVLAEADTVIWLRLPFHTVYRALAWRTVSRSFQGSELWNGNRESLRQTFFSRESMLVWGIAAWRSHHQVVGDSLRTTHHRARVYVLRSRRQVRYLHRNAAPASDTIAGHQATGD
ncbi:MAG: (d)CMP kinase [Dehalococcoidia bacterium]|jgi:adenylate kinase family enzyme|uniref:adenylate kinase n=1 Tax=Candidatus Amarobacter glycogenicus TaxID=3140699 RepID=UPI0031364586|nr:(d)CMP kinase [Dehalococcoidia bacterium]MBK8561318.1 (d)CMP kinase [Dehalococcoidia bacterium]MBK9341876.1 (d)CMP kinase [Dehalococcoidia bacterium]MCC6266184.1 (d)CMP kinase [Dehalococcoidia bacterium]